MSEPAFHRLVIAQRFAAAFGVRAAVRQVDLGPGLWTVLRTDSDSAASVLCVHNPGDHRRSFLPGTLLGHASPPLFLAGEVVTEGDDWHDLVCHLAPQRYVWLGHSAADTRVPTNLYGSFHDR